MSCRLALASRLHLAIQSTSMKAVILAGGLGTRISEETVSRPKPMIEIGGKPILWHIMKIYSAHGINDFIVCCGYKGYMIKEYFANYFLHMSDVTFDMQRNEMEVLNRYAEPWRVTLVDTGENTMTGGRLKRVANHLKDEEAFCFTYGDGVSNVDVSASIKFHRSHGKLATVTAVQPAGRYGALDMTGSCVKGFVEKPKALKTHDLVCLADDVELGLSAQQKTLLSKLKELFLGYSRYPIKQRSKQAVGPRDLEFGERPYDAVCISCLENQYAKDKEVLDALFTECLKERIEFVFQHGHERMLSTFDMEEQQKSTQTQDSESE